MVAGIRGAICVRENSTEAIHEATTELLKRLIGENDLTEDMIAGIFFTATVDLTAAFPAKSLREFGWRKSAALCAHEIAVPDQLERVIRVMIFANVSDAFEAKHQYLGEAARLRPDLTGEKL